MEFIKYLFKRSVFTVALLSVLATLSQLHAQQKITLQQAIETSLKNNLQIKQAKLNEALGGENLKQAKMAIYPNLNASTNLFFNFGRSVDPTAYEYVNRSITTSNNGLNSNLVLFQGRQKFNQISQNKYLLEADKSSTRKAENDLSLMVGTTYLQVLSNRDLLVAAQQQLDITQQQLDRIQKLFDVGNNTLADLSQAKSQKATAELNVTNAQNQLDISYLDLAQLMERNPEDKFDVVSPDIAEMLNLRSDYKASDVYQKAMGNYPDIKLAEFNTLAAKKAVDVARGSYYPALSMSGALATNYSSIAQHMVTTQLNGTQQIGITQNSGDPVLAPRVTSLFAKTRYLDQLDENLTKYFGFSLSIPIFNNFQSRIGVRKAKISYQNALVSEQLAKNNFNKVINQAVLDLRAAEKQYYSNQSAYNSKKDAFTVIQQRFSVGLVNSLDFNQAQTDLNSAQFNFIQAKYNFIFRSKVIDFYLGNSISF